MKYRQLFESYIKLKEENEILRAENVEMRKLLGINNSEYSTNNEEIINNNIECCERNHEKERVKYNTVNNTSNPEEKIDLFMSLFKGRDDVYAKRWEGKSGKSGYSPVCKNEWKKWVCKKPEVKCSQCENKQYAELDFDAINNHLRGNTVLGIFPMLENETCYFLAIDFDDDEWENDVTAIIEVCKEKEISFAVERSRSGSGAHVWFFFSESVSSVVARKFGTSLLTYAMDKRHELKFNSYDRLFPNQDTMPKGGLGNLIALPMQKKARENKNSVFVDENFKVYDDQWKFLSEVRKLNLEEIEKYIKELALENELGPLMVIKDEETKPWENIKKDSKLMAAELPCKINITRANMIYIRKDGFSNKAINKIKRLAAFKNPEFYKAQAMRLTTFNKPRIISLVDETEEYLGIPRGCEDSLIELLNIYDREIVVDDKTNLGNQIKVNFNGELRVEQIQALEELKKYDNGVLSATTAFGKTVIGAKLISEKKINTLVIVHTKQLLDQWINRLKEFLIIDEVIVSDTNNKRGRKKSIDIIGQLGGGKNKLSGIIDVATMQSLIRAGEVKEFIRDYGMVIVDECHHVSALSLEQILKNVYAKYVYGLTATAIRKDGHDPIIFMQCGPIRYKVDPIKQAIKRPFEHYVIPRFTPFKLESNVEKEDLTITDIYTRLLESKIRNQMIIKDVIDCVKSGRNPIVLTERTAHVKTIFEELKKHFEDVIILTGAMTNKEKKEEIEKLQAIPREKRVIIVATGKFVGEGFDEPRLDTLFLAMPISWTGTVQQYAGRLHRLYENKDEVQIYDYVDVHVNVLEKMYRKRLKGYYSIGYEFKSSYKSVNKANSVYNSKNFLEVYNNDILSVKNNIIISSPYIDNAGLTKVMDTFKYLLSKGINIKIITRAKEELKEKSRERIGRMHDILIQSGVELVFKSGLYKRFAVIDNSIVWYGNINLLSFINTEDSIMRLESVEIAHEILRDCGNEVEIAIQESLI